MSKLLTTPLAKAKVSFEATAREAHPKLALPDGSMPIDCLFVRGDERETVTVWLSCEEIPIAETVVVEIHFYCRKHQLRAIEVGDRFELWWSGFPIGAGSIVER